MNKQCVFFGSATINIPFSAILPSRPINVILLDDLVQCSLLFFWFWCSPLLLCRGEKTVRIPCVSYYYPFTLSWHSAQCKHNQGWDRIRPGWLGPAVAMQKCLMLKCIWLFLSIRRKLNWEFETFFQSIQNTFHQIVTAKNSLIQHLQYLLFPFWHFQIWSIRSFMLWAQNMASVVQVCGNHVCMWWRNSIHILKCSCLKSACFSKYLLKHISPNYVYNFC